MNSFGDRLYSRLNTSTGLLYLQGEMAQLTYQAYDKYVQWVNEVQAEPIQVTYPIGYRADRTPISHTYECTKEDLLNRYQYLAHNQLPINGIYQLVTIIDTLLGDILRETLSEYPSKISNKRKVDAEIILEASSLAEIKFAIINSVLNELSYKSPRDFAEEFNKLIGINLLEKPMYHKYIELKATRDIHNSGVANEIYLSKADTLARVRVGEYLPVDIQYFLESYECCLQLTETLEKSLHKIWPSSKHHETHTDVNHIEEREEVIEKIIEETKTAEQSKGKVSSKSSKKKKA